MAHNPREAAVMCWFPTGNMRPIPLSLKYKDNDWIIISIKDLHIIESHIIIQGIKYICKAEINESVIQFVLTFYKDDYKWMISC